MKMDTTRRSGVLTSVVLWFQMLLLSGSGSLVVADVMSCSASLLRRRLTGGRMLSAVHLNVEV